MVWALLFQVLIVGFGLPPSVRERAWDGVLGLAVGPLAMGIAAVTIVSVEGSAGFVVALFACSAGAVFAGLLARRVYRAADAVRPDDPRHERLDTAGGAVLASAVYTGLIAVGTLAWLVLFERRF